MLILPEMVAIFLFIEIRIWFFNGPGWMTAAATVLPILLVFLSWYKNEYLESKLFYLLHARLSGKEIALKEIQKLSREAALSKLGILPVYWKKDWDLILSVTLCFLILILWIGFVWNPNFFIQKEIFCKSLKHILMYYPWALLQNFWMNGYFTNRLAKVFPEQPKLVSLAVGILFAIVHWPNPVLAVATLIGGAMSAYFFQRNRNLYWLALSHAILAVSLLYFLPDAWHHHLRIGPGYWTWKP